jgi:hypothetical protein
MTIDKRKIRSSGIFATREELVEQVLLATANGISAIQLAKEFKVSPATVCRIKNPKVEVKKVSPEDRTNPLIPTLNSLWIVREKAA